MTARTTATAGEARSVAGLMRALGPFLGDPVRPDDARRRVEQHMIERERRFCDQLRRAVFERPASPYRRLLDWAGISWHEVSAVTAEIGVEGALGRLYDEGVYLTFEEFKCLEPIVRPGLELAPEPGDFDNPLATRHYEVGTGGTSGPPRRILVDLALLEHESDYLAGLYAALDAAQRPLALWYPAPPGAVGIKNALVHARLGRPPARWFSQTRPADTSVKHDLFTRSVVLAARARRVQIPFPRHTPAADAHAVVSWLAAGCAEGHPPFLLTTPSACVRACREATRSGADIANTTFVLIGEPFTPSKAAVVASVGAQALSHYGMVETGMIGLACLDADAPDDVHLLTGKIATIQRPVRNALATAAGTALLHTTLTPATPKLLLNVESGDHGVIEARACGCGALPEAYTTHVHTIRSYEKLTSEGMSFLPDDLHELVERYLPERFGGGPGDYQLAEHERNGASAVQLIASASIGPLTDADVVSGALAFLGSRGPAQQMMAEVWRQSGTLRLERGEPTATGADKVFPLRRSGAPAAGARL